MRGEEVKPRNINLEISSQLLKFRQNGTSLAQSGSIRLVRLCGRTTRYWKPKRYFTSEKKHHLKSLLYKARKFTQTQRDRLRYICLTRIYMIVKLWVHNKHSRHFGLNWHNWQKTVLPAIYFSRRSYHNVGWRGGCAKKIRRNPQKFWAGSKTSEIVTKFIFVRVLRCLWTPQTNNFRYL